MAAARMELERQLAFGLLAALASALLNAWSLCLVSIGLQTVH